MTHKETLDELRGPVMDLRDHIPAVSEAYAALNPPGLGDGALDAKAAFPEFVSQ